MARARRCRICGCTETHACIIGRSHETACRWVEADLCSVCAPLAAIEAEISNGTLFADVAYRLGLACGEFRKTLG